MPKYIKKPREVNAEPYKKGLEDGFACVGNDGFCNGECESCERFRPFINTLEGRLFIRDNDYIITGIMGERYPCKKEIFEITYERID